MLNPPLKLRNLLHVIALTSAGVVTALSDHFGRGAVPCPAIRFNPARHLLLDCR